MLLFGSRWSGRGKEIQEGNFLFKAGGRQGQLGSASFISIDYRMKSSIFRDFPILTSTGRKGRDSRSWATPTGL